MRLAAWLFGRDHLYASVVGFCDGVMTALTLAAPSIVGRQGAANIQLALRIAVAASLSGMFVHFTGQYARLLGGLVHAERQLSLPTRGTLAATRLGHAVLIDSLVLAGLTTACSFAGGAFPLILGAFLPGPPWLAGVTAVVSLGLVGVAIARSIQGNSLFWAISLMASGVLLTYVGLLLHLA